MNPSARTPTPEPDLKQDDVVGGGVVIKKTELKKLRDSFRLDENAVIQLVNEHSGLRADRNCTADLVILKQMNKILRKKVEEQKGELQDKDHYLAKQRDIIRIQTAEIKESMSTGKELRKKYQTTERNAGKIILLEKQLADLTAELQSERQLNARVAEGVVLNKSRQTAQGFFPQPKKQAIVAATASLAVAVSVFHIVDTNTRPPIARYAPLTVASSLALLSYLTITTEASPPAVTSRGSMTDVSVTEFGYVPALEDIPRGQELLRALRQKDGEIANLKRVLHSHNEKFVRAQRVIEKLEGELNARTETVAKQGREFRGLEEVSRSQIEALESRIDSLRAKFIAVCQEVSRLKKGQSQTTARSAQKSLPVPIPRGVHQLPVNSSSGRTPSNRITESPSKGSGCSDSDDVPPFMEMTPIEEAPTDPSDTNRELSL